jgi:hypothetical protein
MERKRLTYEEAVALAGSEEKLAEITRGVGGLGAVDIAGVKLRILNDEGEPAYFIEKP